MRILQVKLMQFTLSCGVMVAQQILVLSDMVRVHAGQQGNLRGTRIQLMFNFKNIKYEGK